MSKRKFDRDVERVRELASDFGWTVMTSEYPTLRVVVIHPKTGRRVGLGFTCDGWDADPPSFAVVEPDSGVELGWEGWPQGWPVGNPHPVTKKPFLCLPGIREYHIHDSHLGDKWEGYRAAGRHKLVDIVIRVKQRFGDSNG